MLIGDDPKEFASLVIKLFSDNHLWNRLSAAALDFAKEHYSRDKARDVVARVLGAPPMTGRAAPNPPSAARTEVAE